MADKNHHAKISVLPALMALLHNSPYEVDERHALITQSNRWWKDDLPFAELFLRLHYWVLQIREDFEFDYTKDETEAEFFAFVKKVIPQYEEFFQVLQSGAAQTHYLRTC
mgnify:CR=1 FL=1